MKDWWKSLSVWMHGLVAAGIAGFANGATVMIADPAHFNWGHDGFVSTAKVAAISAAFAVAAVLKQSPLPKPCDPEITPKP
jgi:hypothetical protein